MSSDYISVTLPLTQQGLNVIVVALFIAILTGVIWLALSDRENERPDPARRALEAFGWVYMPIWLIIFAATLWSLWQVFSGVGSPVAQDGFRSLGLGALIAALLGAPFVIWGTVLKHQTVMFQKEGHMTDRINKAVEQLGAEKVVKKIIDGGTQETSEPNIEVRIGAILSLERIAQDSTRHDKGRDHVRVMEILCAYIRENSGIDTACHQNPRGKLIKRLNDELKKNELKKERFLKAITTALSDPELSAPELDTEVHSWLGSLKRKVRIDIQTAINVIGRRSESQISIERNDYTLGSKSLRNRIDTIKEKIVSTSACGETLKAMLNRQNFKSTDGYRPDLSSVNFQGYDFRNLDFSLSKMQGCAFQGAVLDNCSFIGADLSDSLFSDTSFYKCDFSFCDIAHCYFLSCYGNSAMFIANNIQGCAFIGGNISNSKFIGISFHGARFVQVNLYAVAFNVVNSDNVSFLQCRLSSSELQGFNFDQFSDFLNKDNGPLIIGSKVLENAIFKNTVFAEGAVFDADISRAFGDGSVELPKRVDRPCHWPDWKLPSDGSEYDFVKQYHKWRADPATYKPPEKPQP